jgi:hypothetical protein
MTFALDIRAFAEKAKANANAVVRDAVSGVVEEVDRRSPVGDPAYWVRPAPPHYEPGLFRGNWQLSVDAPILTEITRIDPDGTEAKAENLATIPAQAFGHVYYLMNNVPYANRIENGWSTRQAPNGVVGLTVARWEEIVAESLAAVPA